MQMKDVIRQKRRERGLTQEQVAERLGVSAPAVNSKRQIFLRIS